MKFASIGTRAASLFSPYRRNNREAGFTLLEALAALTLILAFAAALTPLLFHARRIMLYADGRVAAQILARALLQEPLDRAGLANLARDGTTEGLEWQLRSEPTDIAASFPPHAQKQTPLQPGQNTGPGASTGQWVPYRIIASVSWAPGQVVRAETVRLGKTAE
ncbi:MAG TPA: prepilin-type N-terminal cleavage/methylation domain-containing protein [Xanthobacteraceae bacterium]|nr:prepilin-type N-terminal cleavage/methylation domain-containing protein [Xanthobacteraceae bacterium]